MAAFFAILSYDYPAGAQVTGVFRLTQSRDLVNWFSVFGASVRLFVEAVNLRSFAYFDRAEFSSLCVWLGLRSFHMIALSAMFVGIALTIECVIELQKYNAQDISGAAISIGLLRELGPMTVSLAWCARVAALYSEEARNYSLDGGKNFAQRFVFPRYLAAVAMSIPLGAYGLVIGFITGALFAPLLGVNSTNDFLESAHMGVHRKDVVVYFVKLVAINPTIGVFSGCLAGKAARSLSEPVAANAVTATFIGGYIANLAITIVAYLTH
ncbi:MAG TPA: ABC transporter permease [Chroococcales cyanobacterium]